MLNPLNPDHRLRFSRALENSHTELQRFARMRDSTVKAYLGVSPHAGDWDWSGLEKKYRDSLPKGNLLQLAGLNMQIALAYGEPEFLSTARVPEQAGLAEKLGPALNRMAKLLNLGDVARDVAADSFFGYGIFKVGIGELPLSAQAATGLRVGPCVWRVGQNNFLYDISASNWDNVSYVGDSYPMALNDAQELYPHAADRLTSMSGTDQLDSKHVLARPSQFQTAEEEVWLVDIYFPQARLVATWLVQNESFRSVSDEPLSVREYEGHWSGVYQVLNHLYAPDELVPVAQAESVKSLHFLFNDLLHLTSEQARHAKVNPMYQTGADKDMRRLWDAADRRPVGVTDPSRFGLFEVPGPTQSQTAYMAAVMQMFKQFVPAADEPQRAPTATQGALMRQSTNAVIAEARRKFNRALQMVGYKLGYLLMGSDEITLPASKPLRPGSRVSVDISWNPASLEPRTARIDDFDIDIEPYSTIYRAPEERQQQLFAAVSQIVPLMQLQASGAPINMEEVLSTMAEYSRLPELKNWFEEVDPLHAAKRQSSRISAPRLGVGQYVRHNVSEKTDAGALEANLGQAMGDDGSSSRLE